MAHTIGISEMAVTNGAEDVLITYSLGSCLGISLYDPVAKVGGMIHCMLPLSKVDRDKARKKPAMFVDTGVPALLQQLFELGAKRNRLVVKVAGGARVFDKDDHFKIGERNYTILRKVLWKNSILIDGEEVGGTVARTMSLEMADGTTRIKSKGRQWEI